MEVPDQPVREWKYQPREGGAIPTLVRPQQGVPPLQHPLDPQYHHVSLSVLSLSFSLLSIFHIFFKSFGVAFSCCFGKVCFFWGGR